MRARLNGNYSELIGRCARRKSPRGMKPSGGGATTSVPVLRIASRQLGANCQPMHRSDFSVTTPRAAVADVRAALAVEIRVGQILHATMLESDGGGSVRKIPKAVCAGSSVAGGTPDLSRGDRIRDHQTQRTNAIRRPKDAGYR